MEPRPEVVQRIMDAWLDADPSALEDFTPLPTLEEVRRGMEAAGQVFIARSPDAQRRVEVWQILTEVPFDTDRLSYAQIWAQLTSNQRDRLVELYDVLPDELVPFVQAYREEQSR